MPLQHLSRRREGTQTQTSKSQIAALQMNVLPPIILAPQAATIFVFQQIKKVNLHK